MRWSTILIIVMVVLLGVIYYKYPRKEVQDIPNTIATAPFYPNTTGKD